MTSPPPDIPVQFFGFPVSDQVRYKPLGCEVHVLLLMLRKAAGDDKQLVYRLRTEAVVFRNVACFC